MRQYLYACALVLTMDAAASAQETRTEERAGALKVFLDCGSCDENYFRTEIRFINYVRDRADADVHVLVTTQGTGGGGVEYTIRYIGLGPFAGVEHTMKHFASQTATDDERRAGLAATVRLGLVRYAADTPLAPRLKVLFDAEEKSAKAAPAKDPWNYWIFRIGGSGSFEGQESGSEKSVSGEFSANRTTAAWKIDFNADVEYSQEKFVLDEGETFTSVSRNVEVNALVAKSLTEHWSVGGVGAFESSIFSNYDSRTRVGAGIEYNVFPYSQSTRRILTLLYTVGMERATYLETTIFGKDEQTLMDHRLETTLGLRQPWGSASASFELLQYLNESGKYRLSTFGSVDVRLFKGFSVEFFGEASRRRDQLSLRRGDATNEEILVRQRELATGYEYDFGFGITYSFGSIFNNVVNPRFRNAGGF
ncbi:MAG TPA: DUF481 domain-containing protein [Vicinamibacterales bacterium]|jgi:hypothetical protein